MLQIWKRVKCRAFPLCQIFNIDPIWINFLHKQLKEKKINR